MSAVLRFRQRPAELGCPDGCTTRPDAPDPQCARYRIRFVNRDWADSAVFIDGEQGPRLTSLRELARWVA